MSGRPSRIFNYRLNHRSRGVPTRRIVLAMIAIELYHLCEVGLSRKNVLDSFPIEVESISCDLEAMLLSDPLTKHREELIGGFAVALADSVSRDQFCFGINRNEHPSITDLW